MPKRRARAGSGGTPEPHSRYRSVVAGRAVGAGGRLAVAPACQRLLRCPRRLAGRPTGSLEVLHARKGGLAVAGAVHGGLGLAARARRGAERGSGPAPESGQGHRAWQVELPVSRLVVWPPVSREVDRAVADAAGVLGRGRDDGLAARGAAPDEGDLRDPRPPAPPLAAEPPSRPQRRPIHLRVACVRSGRSGDVPLSLDIPKEPLSIPDSAMSLGSRRC